MALMKKLKTRPAAKPKMYGPNKDMTLTQWLDRPMILDGYPVTDDELAEFLDWRHVDHGYEMFKHLKDTGWFDKHPITAKDLAATAEKKAKHAKTLEAYS